MHNKTVEEIVKEEIAQDIKTTMESIALYESRLDLCKRQLEKLRKQEACDGHEFVSLGGGMESLSDVCSKCSREYSYQEFRWRLKTFLM